MAKRKTQTPFINKRASSVSDANLARKDPRAEHTPDNPQPSTDTKNENIIVAAEATPSTPDKPPAPAPVRRAPADNKTTTLTPGQLAKLKNCDRVNIFIGHGNDQFIAVESAYRDLLCHFSTLCGQRLRVEGASRITVPFGDKHTVVFIYRWMLAGGRDSTVEGHMKFADLRLPDLLTLYRHCVFLGFDDLEELAKTQLEWKLQRVVPTVEQIDFTLQFAPAVSDAAMESLTRLLLRPLVFNSEAYYSYAQKNKSFGTALDKAIEDHRATMIRERHTPYNGQSVPVKGQGAATKGRKQEQDRPRRAGNRRRRRAAPAPSRNGGVPSGDDHPHSGRQSQAQAGPRVQADKQPRRAPTAYSGIKLFADGEGLTTCTRAVRKGEITRTGLLV